MGKLETALSDFNDGKIGTEMLEEAMIRWATYSLSTYKDNLLRKALEVSISIANFTAAVKEGCDE